MPVKMTDSSVSKAQAKASRHEIADALQPGLRLVVQTSGKKSWAYRYERTDGKGVKITLGPASGPGAMSLTDARIAANDAMRLRLEGTDPADHKRATRAAEAARLAAEEQEARRRADTVEKVLARYYADHADKLKSGAEIRRVLNKELKGWSNRRVDDIQRRDAKLVLNEVKARAPIQSKRLRAYARHFFQWCIHEDLVETNPFDGTAVVKEVARKRILNDDELRLLLRAIELLEWPRRQFLHLLLLTAQRFSEVANMEWSQLDLKGDKPLWTLPDTKNGNAHIAPLAPVAVETLASMDKLKNSPSVFASFSATHVKARIDELMLQIAREDATAAGDDPDRVNIAPWRLHDLRRTAATTMPRLGVEVGIVERVLNHQMRGVMAVYQLHPFTDETRHALNLWADFLANLTAARESNVVPIRAEVS